MCHINYLVDLAAHIGVLCAIVATVIMDCGLAGGFRVWLDFRW